MEIRIEKVIISRRARKTIEEIYKYVKDRSKSVEAVHYVRKSIVDKCHSLKEFAGYAKEPYLEEYPEDYRSVSLWSYIIIFVIRKNVVRVLNIVHGKQNPEIRKNL